ncbi:hypothetical protein P7C70_g3812, partial [Phenoliferia sp. Uapishka_3]
MHVLDNPPLSLPSPYAKPLLDTPESYGRLLLATALSVNSLEVFLLLLEHGANPFAVAGDGLLVESLLEDAVVGGMESKWRVELTKAKEAWKAKGSYLMPIEIRNNIERRLWSERRVELEASGKAVPRLRASDLYEAASGLHDQEIFQLDDLKPSSSAQPTSQLSFSSKAESAPPPPPPAAPLAKRISTDAPPADSSAKRPRVYIPPDVRPPTPSLPSQLSPTLPYLPAQPDYIPAIAPEKSTDPRKRLFQTTSAPPPTANLKFLSLPPWITQPLFLYWLENGPSCYDFCEDVESVEGMMVAWPDGQGGGEGKMPKPMKVIVSGTEGWVTYGRVQDAEAAKDAFFGAVVADKVPGAKAVGVRHV